MEVFIYEVIKEYTVYVSELGYSVKGRVKKDINADHNPFQWESSHYYKPFEEAIGVYTPSRVTAKTFEEAEILLLQYLSNFKTYYVQKNDLY